MKGEYDIDGDDKPTLHEAFESAAEKAEALLKSQGVDPEDVSRRRFNATISIETQPRNQWVKAYKVKITPGG